MAGSPAAPLVTRTSAPAFSKARRSRSTRRGDQEPARVLTRSWTRGWRMVAATRSEDLANLFGRAAEAHALFGFDERTLDQDRVSDHGLENGIVRGVLKRPGGVLAAA